MAAIVGSMSLDSASSYASSIPADLSSLRHLPGIEVAETANFRLLPLGFLPRIDVIDIRLGDEIILLLCGLEVLAHTLLRVCCGYSAIGADPLASPSGFIVFGAALAANFPLPLFKAFLLVALLLKLREGVDKYDNVLDDDFVQGPVGSIGLDVLHLGEDVDSFSDATEDGMFPIQVRCRLVCEEELA